VTIAISNAISSPFLIVLFVVSAANIRNYFQKAANSSKKNDPTERFVQSGQKKGAP
jgi:hypothetical protein